MFYSRKSARLFAEATLDASAINVRKSKGKKDGKYELEEQE
jgi:hypothetical protein